MTEVIAVIVSPVKTLKQKIIEKIQEIIIPSSVKTLAVIGGIFAGFKTLWFSWNILSFVSETFLSGYDLRKRYGHNSWALITDASDDLGKTFAIELGSIGFNVILVGNDLNKLREVNKHLARLREKPLSKIIAIDLAQAYTDDFIEKTFAEVQDLDVSIIINNARKAPNGDFAEQKNDEIRDSIVINNIVPALLTRLFINSMYQRELKSAIINISTVNTVEPSFQNVLYNSSQEFMKVLSQATMPQFSGKIDILTYKACFADPRYVNRTNIFSVTSQQTAHSCLDQVGRRKETYGYWKHRLFGGLYCRYPKFRKFSEWLMLKTSEEIKYKPEKLRKSNILKHNYQ